MKVWALTDGPVREGKYLVVRRDGTIPPWGHFVIADVDPCASAALDAYANEAERLGLETDFVQSVRELSALYSEQAVRAAERAAAGVAKAPDPDKGPHRTDNLAVVAMMRGEGDLTGYSSPTPERERGVEIDSGVIPLQDATSSGDASSAPVPETWMERFHRHGSAKDYPAL